MRVNAHVDERTLREIYLAAFERVVKESQPTTVMCSYNKINGVYSSENTWLLQDVLRGEWGFEGVVVSDWGAVHRPAVSVAAGLDLEMPGTGGRSVREIVAAVESGELTETAIGRSVDRVLKLARREPVTAANIDIDAHHELARSAAASSIVLLKNDRKALPLHTDSRIAVIGEFARSPRFQGGGSSHVNATRVDAFLDAAQSHGAAIEFAPGFTLDGVGDEKTLLEEAVGVAGRADVAVVFAGLSEAHESEGFDRDSLNLPAAQIELIRAIARQAATTVVVLSHGGVVSLEGWHDDVDAIVDGFLLGQASGSALADIVFGLVNPSGRLAETIPLRLEDTPAFGNFPGEQGNVVYGERALVGYRWFATRDAAVRYPFGHGLSYTTFQTHGFQVETNGPSSATVHLTVENTGDRDGAYVVQIYVDATATGLVQRSARELRAFRKVHVPAGATAEVEIPLDRRAFAYWDVEQHDWVVAPGPYRVILGADALVVDAESTIELEGDTIIRELTLGSTAQEWFEHPIVGGILLDRLDSDLLRAMSDPAALRMLGSLPMQKVINLLGDSVAAIDVQELMAMTTTEGDADER